MHLKRVGTILAAVMAAACGGGGYEKVDGEWALVGWNEGSGKTVRKLGADGPTFTVLRRGLYAKDRRRVFYEAQPIDGADPGTFAVLGDGPYAKDAAHVFLMAYRVRGADPATFKPLGAPYARDAARAYNGTVPMDVADLAHFEVLPCTPSCGWGTHYTRDDFLFEFGDTFSGLEVSQQNPLVTGGVGAGWARDGRYYYFGPARMEGADYATFKIVSPFQAADARRKYMWSFPESEAAERRKRFLHQ